MPVVNFTDSAGIRHEGVELPASLLKPGVSHRQQQQYLIRSGAIADPSAPPLTAPEEPEVVQQQVMDDARAAAIEQRLTSLEQLDRPQLPSEEALAQWARAAERVGLSHAELAATQEAVINKAEQVGTDAQNRLGELDNQQQALITTVTESVASSKDELNASILASQAQLSEFEAEAEARAVANAESKAMTAAREEARRLMPNYAGISSITCTEDPIDVDGSWNDRWLGRKPKVGDTAWVVSKSGITFRRYIDGGWSADAPELEPRVEVASQPLAVLDMSTHVPAPAGPPPPAVAGGGGGGGEPLSTRVFNKDAETLVAVGDRWAAALDRGANPADRQINAAKVILTATAVDGTRSGQTCFSTFALLHVPASGTNPDRIETTEFDILGPLSDLENLIFDFKWEEVSPTIPSWVTPAPVFTHTDLKVPKVSLTIKATGAEAPTKFMVAGALTWVFPWVATPHDGALPGDFSPTWGI